jgi:hypothetical protein
LASVIEALLSGSLRRGPAAPEAGEPTAETTPRDPPRPRLEVVTAVTCGEPSSGPLFLLALAALPTAAPRTVALSPRGGEAAWIGPLADAPDRLAQLERDGGRVVVLVPPADGPEVRALAFAASSHLLWLDSSPPALAQAGEFLEALHFGADGARVGWLLAPDVDQQPVERVFLDWCALGPRRAATALGLWRPGQPLPTSVCGFLAGAAHPAAGPLTWAWSMLPGTGMGTGTR